MYEEKEMIDKKCDHWCRRRWYLCVLFAIIGILIFGFLVMLLWNCVMPAVFKLGAITFWKAIELLVLSKILFGMGGFKRGCGCRRGRFYGHRWKEKWMGMSEEERAKFKEEWKNRGGSCGC